MRVIEVSGTHYECGVQEGKAFKEEIGHFLTEEQKQYPDTQERKHKSKIIAGLIQSFFPEALDGIRGISDGSEKSYEDILFLNTISSFKHIPYQGCCSVAVKKSTDGPILARNCDLYKNEIPWQVAVKRKALDGHVVFRITYAGMVSGIGINSKGLSIGGASVPTKIPLKVCEGIPIDLFPLYLLAKCETTTQAIEEFNKLNFTGKGINLIVIDELGEMVLFELAATGQKNLQLPAKGDKFIACTNMFHSNRMDSTTELKRSTAALEGMRSSCNRYEYICQFIEENHSNISKEKLMELMGSHQGKTPVCEHVPGGFWTAYSSICLAGRKEIYIADGNPCCNPYYKFTLY